MNKALFFVFFIFAKFHCIKVDRLKAFPVSAFIPLSAMESLTASSDPPRQVDWSALPLAVLAPDLPANHLQCGLRPLPSRLRLVEIFISGETVPPSLPAPVAGASLHGGLRGLPLLQPLRRAETDPVWWPPLIP